MTSRLRFVDEYLFNNQYSFPLNRISIIIHITNPLNTNLIYVIIITAKDKITFLGFRQIWERRYNTYDFFKKFLSERVKFRASYTRNTVDKFDFLQDFFLSRPCSINSLRLLILTLTKWDMSSLSKSKS